MVHEGGYRESSLWAKMCDGTTQLCIIRVMWTNCVPLISFPSESTKQNMLELDTRWFPGHCYAVARGFLVKMISSQMIPTPSVCLYCPLYAWLGFHLQYVFLFFFCLGYFIVCHLKIAHLRKFSSQYAACFQESFILGRNGSGRV